MTPEEQAAYVFAQSVSALIEALGMLSADLAYFYKGGAEHTTSMPYFGPEEFNKLIDKYGISHNGVLGFFRL